MIIFFLLRIIEIPYFLEYFPLLNYFLLFWFTNSNHEANVFRENTVGKNSWLLFRLGSKWMTLLFFVHILCLAHFIFIFSFFCILVTLVAWFSLCCIPLDYFVLPALPCKINKRWRNIFATSFTKMKNKKMEWNQH